MEREKKLMKGKKKVGNFVLLYFARSDIYKEWVK